MHRKRTGARAEEKALVPARKAQAQHSINKPTRPNILPNSLTKSIIPEHNPDPCPSKEGKDQLRPHHRTGTVTAQRKQLSENRQASITSVQGQNHAISRQSR
jgi:hypothetical protein